MDTAATEARIAAFRALLADRGLPADDVPEESLVELLGALDAANEGWPGVPISDERVAYVVATVATGRNGSFVGFAHGIFSGWPPRYRVEQVGGEVRVGFYNRDFPIQPSTQVALPGL